MGGAARILVLLAHPDDEVLLCGGTIFALGALGCSVEVVCFCDGAQGRHSAFSGACDRLGASGELLTGHSTSAMTLDGALVGATDALIRGRSPDCVITHTRSGRQNQDHVVLHNAVRLTVARFPTPPMVLAAEPPLSSAEFSPNVFVDVSESFQAKCVAAASYRDLLHRDYMSDDYLRVRAQWWGQVAGRPRALFEAYELVIWR